MSDDANPVLPSEPMDERKRQLAYRTAQLVIDLCDAHARGDADAVAAGCAELMALGDEAQWIGATTTVHVNDLRPAVDLSATPTPSKTPLRAR